MVVTPQVLARAVAGFLQRGSGKCCHLPSDPACAGPECRCWALRVWCDECERFHLHGAGDGLSPVYSAGGETSRSEHCRGSYGERIVIVSESFDPSWTSGARGRLTVAGRAALDRAAAELRDA